MDSRKLADRIQLYDSLNQFRWICYLSSVRFVTGFQNYHKLIDILPRWDPLGWMKAFKSFIWVYFHLLHVLKVCLKLAGRGVRQQFGGRKNCDKNWLQLLRCYERYTRGNGGYTPYSFIQFQFWFDLKCHFRLPSLKTRRQIHFLEKSSYFILYLHVNISWA